MQGHADQNLIDSIYKLSKSHKNHPCTKWANETLGNRTWLYDHALHMCMNYSYASGGKIHKSERILTNAYKHSMTENQLSEVWREEGEKSPETKKSLTITYPPLCIPDEYKMGADTPVESYRKAYAHDKQCDKNGKWMLNYTRAFSILKGRTYPTSKVFLYDSSSCYKFLKITAQEIQKFSFSKDNYVLIPAFIIDEWCNHISAFKIPDCPVVYACYYTKSDLKSIMDKYDQDHAVWIAFKKTT